MAEIAEENAAVAAIEARDVDDADIRDTDIEFSCPHCGNSMVIDYRGAGLQVACSQCGETVLVPAVVRSLHLTGAATLITATV